MIRWPLIGCGVPTENLTLLTLAFIPQYRGISIAQRAILYAMARYTNQQSKSFWPSMGTLAKELDSDPRYIRRLVNDLEARGIIRRVGRKAVQAGEVIEWRMRSPKWVSDRTPGSLDPPSPVEPRVQEPSHPGSNGGGYPGSRDPTNCPEENCISNCGLPMRAAASVESEEGKPF